MELGVVYPGTGGRSGKVLLIKDVNLDLKDSRDEADVILWGMMFQSLGPMTAKDFSKEGYDNGFRAECAHRI